MELESADVLVGAAHRRVQELNRFSRTAPPIGKAELATVALQALAELGALADWTVRPGMTDSIVQLLDANERKEFERIQEFVQRAAAQPTTGDGQSSVVGSMSERPAMEIDPAPAKHSRTATFDEVIADEALGARAAEAIVYQLYHDIVERAVILLERSAAARQRLWPLVWIVATLIPPPDLSLRRDGATDSARS